MLSACLFLYVRVDAKGWDNSMRRPRNLAKTTRDSAVT